MLYDWRTDEDRARFLCELPSKEFRVQWRIRWEKELGKSRADAIYQRGMDLWKERFQLPELKIYEK